MTTYWLGVLTGALIVWALGTITLVAIRAAEHGVPMAGGHWPDPEPDELDTELRHLLTTDGQP